MWGRIANLGVWRRNLIIAGSLLLALPQTVLAAGLTSRSDVLSTSAAGSTASHVVSFTTATTNNIGSIKFEFCTTSTGACSVPSGLVSTGATLTAQSGTGATGFSMVNTVNGAPYVTRSASSIAASTAVSYTLGNVVNPSVTNQTFYVRITTYTGTDGSTGAVDTGTVAVSTAEPIQLTGVTPEILIFCVGITITTDCTTVSGNSIDFGDFSPIATRSATSVMQALTNAGGGYAITVNGTTLSSGANTIAACGSGCASATGGGQFGLNLRANTTPAVGADKTGGGSGTPTGNYNTQNQYRFNSGEAVASAPAPTNANTYTASYIVNIGGSQAAGVYTATMTYVCTASF